MSELTPFWIVVGLLLASGFYYVLVTRNLLRLLMGLELLTKGATLLLIVAGHHTGRMDLAQSLVISLIVVEVVVISVAAGIIFAVWRRHGSLETLNLKRLRESP